MYQTLLKIDTFAPHPSLAIMRIISPPIFFNEILNNSYPLNQYLYNHIRFTLWYISVLFNLIVFPGQLNAKVSKKLTESLQFCFLD